MRQYQITCVTEPDRISRHEHITHVGNPAVNWRITREEGIRLTEGRVHELFTIDLRTGARSFVGVVRELRKSSYLRTYADGLWNDSLLALTECSLA